MSVQTVKTFMVHRGWTIQTFMVHWQYSLHHEADILASLSLQWLSPLFEYVITAGWSFSQWSQVASSSQGWHVAASSLSWMSCLQSKISQSHAMASCLRRSTHDNGLMTSALAVHRPCSSLGFRVHWSSCNCGPSDPLICDILLSWNCRTPFAESALPSGRVVDFWCDWLCHSLLSCIAHFYRCLNTPPLCSRFQNANVKAIFSPPCFILSTLSFRLTVSSSAQLPSTPPCSSPPQVTTVWRLSFLPLWQLC